MIRRFLLCLGPLFLLVYVSCATSLQSTADTPIATGTAWRGPETIGQITEPTISEASGLAASHRTPGILWTHNDSGGEPVLYAIDTSGKYLGSVRIEGAVNRDWEDAASYEIDGRTYLIAADIGDNNATYPECTLYVIAEPEASALSTTHELVIMPERIIRYVYPEGPRDCESLAVDVRDQAIYLISKRTTPPVAYRLPLLPEETSRPLTAEKIGTVNGIPLPSGLISLMAVPWGKWRAQPCSLDISPNGQHAAILTYGEVYLYERHSDEDWASAFVRDGQPLTAHNLPQAEALCFAPDGQTLYVTTEGSPAPLIRYTTHHNENALPVQ